MYEDLINQSFDLIGKVPLQLLSAPFVSFRHNSLAGELAQYPMSEIFADYTAEKKAQAAFVGMLEKSDCPFVKAYIQAVQACFVKQNLDELELFSEIV